MCSTNISDNRNICEQCGEKSYCMYITRDGDLVCDKCIDKEREYEFNRKN